MNLRKLNAFNRFLEIIPRYYLAIEEKYRLVAFSNGSKYEDIAGVTFRRSEFVNQGNEKSSLVVRESDYVKRKC